MKRSYVFGIGLICVGIACGKDGSDAALPETNGAAPPINGGGSSSAGVPTSPAIDQSSSGTNQQPGQMAQHPSVKIATLKGLLVTNGGPKPAQVALQSRRQEAIPGASDSGAGDSDDASNTETTPATSGAAEPTKTCPFPQGKSLTGIGPVLSFSSDP